MFSAKGSTRATLAMGLWLFAGPAQAAVIVTVTESATGVLFEGGGTLDVSTLTAGTAGESGPAGVQADPAFVHLGPIDTQGFTRFLGITGPAGFGSGTTLATPTTGAGDRFGLDGDWLIVPSGYMGGLLQASNTFTGATLADLGLAPGTYVWSWGNPGTGDRGTASAATQRDSFTLEILDPAVTAPEPTAIAMLALAAVAVAARRRIGPR